ncbi:MAG: hypothetical protein ACFFCZ_18440 [Promethearchaeota archaeon]
MSKKRLKNEDVPSPEDVAPKASFSPQDEPKLFRIIQQVSSSNQSAVYDDLTITPPMARLALPFWDLLRVTNQVFTSHQSAVYDDLTITPAMARTFFSVFITDLLGPLSINDFFHLITLPPQEIFEYAQRRVTPTYLSSLDALTDLSRVVKQVYSSNQSVEYEGLTITPVMARTFIDLGRVVKQVCRSNQSTVFGNLTITPAMAQTFLAVYVQLSTASRLSLLTRPTPEIFHYVHQWAPTHSSGTSHATDRDASTD